MRCMLEARLEGRQPIAVPHYASSLDEAVDGTADKLATFIMHSLGRQREQQRHRTGPATSPPEPDIEEEP